MRVVILRALKLGDFLAAVPAYRAIRRAYPAAHIALAAPRAFAPLVELLDGAIDELIETAELAPLPSSARGADVGINLHGRGPQSHRLLLAARVKSLIAFYHPDIPESAGGPRDDPAEHEVRRWCRFLRHAGIDADPNDLDLRVPPITVPRRIHRATLIHPGAASESRRWPIGNWIDVACAELRAGRHVIVTGGPDELERARVIAAEAGIPPMDVYAGRTTLRELAALVAHSARVVCGDTGIAHLATAFRKPSVVLFGPTPPTQWGPPPRSFHRVLWKGSTGDPHAPRVDPGLARITPAEVSAALAALPS